MGEDRQPRALAALHDELNRAKNLLLSGQGLSAQSKPRVLGLVDRFGLFVVRAFGVASLAEVTVVRSGRPCSGPSLACPVPMISAEEPFNLRWPASPTSGIRRWRE